MLGFCPALRTAPELIGFFVRFAPQIMPHLDIAATALHMISSYGFVICINSFLLKKLAQEPLSHISLRHDI